MTPPGDLKGADMAAPDGLDRSEARICVSYSPTRCYVYRIQVCFDEFSTEL